MKRIVGSLIVIAGLLSPSLTVAEEQKEEEEYTEFFGAGLGWSFPRQANTVGALLSPDTVAMRFVFGKIKIEPSVSLNFGSSGIEPGDEQVSGAKIEIGQPGLRSFNYRVTSQDPISSQSAFGLVIGAVARVQIFERSKTKFQVLGGINLGFGSSSQTLEFREDQQPPLQFAPREITGITSGKVESSQTSFGIGLLYGLAVEQYVSENISFSFDILPPPILSFISTSNSQNISWQGEGGQVENRKREDSSSQFNINLPLQAPQLRITLFLYF